MENTLHVKNVKYICSRLWKQLIKDSTGHAQPSQAAWYVVGRYFWEVKENKNSDSHLIRLFGEIEKVRPDFFYSNTSTPAEMALRGSRAINQRNLNPEIERQGEKVHLRDRSNKVTVTSRIIDSAAKREKSTENRRPYSRIP